MIWMQLLWWVVSFALQDYFRAKLPNVDPSGEGDFQAPTATEGRKVPQIVGGTVRVNAPNCLWYGDWEAVPVTVETGVIFKRDETVGYEYSIGLALGLIAGEVEGMTGIWLGDDKIWDYVDDNGGSVATVADINLPDLFGGYRQGGGFVGRVRLFPGTNSQGVSSYLQSKIPLQSRWPGFCYAVITNATEDGGANIGEQNALRDIRIELQAFSTLANGGLGNGLGLTSDEHIIGRDVNPIAAAYKVLTDPDWGIATGDINFTNFQTIGAQVFDEGIGYSQLVDNEIEAWEVLAEIEKHIDGYIGPNPGTGLLEITLARNDYTPASEFQANLDNILEIKNYSKSEWPQVKNEVKIRYVDRDKDYKDAHAVTQDMAGRLITGRPQSITIRYPGLRDATAANKIAARVSRSYFWPLAKFEMEMDRTAWDIRPGDVLIVTHPDIKATDLPVRATRVRTGDPIKQTIRIDVVQDVFADETGTQAAPPASEFIPPSTDPQPISIFQPLNMPRFMHRYHGVSEEFGRPALLVSRDRPNTGFFFQYRSRATPFSGNFAGYYEAGTFNTFMPYGTLRDAVPNLQGTQSNNGSASTANGGGFIVDGNLSRLVGTYTPFATGNITGLAVIDPEGPNEEWVAISEIVVNGGGIECQGVVRGLGLTATKPHDAGEEVWFMDTVFWPESARPEETDGTFGIQYQYKSIAPGGEEVSLTTSGEFAVRYDLQRNYPDAPVSIYLMPRTGATFGIYGNTWFPDGLTIDAASVNSTNAPTACGFYIAGFNRRTDQENFVFAANAVADDGARYSNTELTDMNYTLHWWIYDLDATPDPTQGTDAVMSGTQTGGTGDDMSVLLDLETDIWPEIDSGNIPAVAPLNARFELAFSNQGSPIVDGVLAGNLSDFVRCDNLLTYPIPPTHPEIRQKAYTRVLLHFDTDTDGATVTNDASLYNAPVSLSGGATLRKDTSPKTSPEQPDNIVSTGYLEIIPDTVSPLPSPGTFVEVADVSPNQWVGLDNEVGMVWQFKIWFTEAPGASTGEYPILTKWRDSDQERTFWIGLVNNTFVVKWTLNGTTVRTETSSADTLNAGQWYDITVVQYTRPQWSSQARIFWWVDGVQHDFNFPSISIAGPLYESSAPFRVGADGDGNQAPAPFYIDEVRVISGTVPYPCDFTPITDPFPGREFEVPLLLTFQDGADGDTAYNSDDLNNMPATFAAVGSPLTQIDDQGPFEGSPLPSPREKSLLCSGFFSSGGAHGIWFEGTEAGGTYADRWDIGLNPTTWECFVKLNTYPGPSLDGAGLITSYHRTGISPWYDYLFYLLGDGRLQFAYQDPAQVVTSMEASLGSPVIIGQWYHAAFVRDANGEAALFWDGQRIGYDASSFANINFQKHDSGRIAVGRFYAPSTTGGGRRYRPLDGNITNVRVLNGVAAYDPTQTTLTVPTAYFTV